MRPFLAAALLLLVAGCAAEPLGAPGGGRALAMERVEDCASKQGTELHRLVTTAAEWAQLWRQACGDGSVLAVAAQEAGAAPPAVDFAAHSVVVSFWGEKSNGGFGVRILNVTGFADRVLVEVERARAGQGCFSTQALTYPHDIVVIERTTQPAQFRFQDRIMDCP